MATPSAFREAIAKAFAVETPPGVEKVFGPSQTRNFFEDLWQDGGLWKRDFGDLWNERRLWEGRDLLGRGQKPGLETGDEANPQAAAQTATDPAQPAPAQQQLRHVVDSINPQARGHLEQGLNSLLAEPMQRGTVSLDDLADNPQEFMTEYMAKLPPEDRTAFERRIEEFIQQDTESRARAEATAMVQREDADPSHHALAFLASAIGSEEAGRIHEYLRSRGADGTLAGAYGDNDDEDTAEERAQKDIARQFAINEMLENINSQIANLQNDIAGLESDLANVRKWQAQLAEIDELRAQDNALAAEQTQLQREQETIDAEQQANAVALAQTGNDIAITNGEIVTTQTALAQTETALLEQVDDVSAREANLFAKYGIAVTGDGSIQMRNAEGQLVPVSESERQTLIETIPELRQVLERQSQADETRGERDRLREELKGLEERLERQVATQAELRERQQTLDGREQEIQTRLGEIETQRTQLAADISQKETALANDPAYQQYLREHNIDPNDPDAVKTFLNANEAELEQSLAQKRSELQELQQQKSELETEASQQTTSLSLVASQQQDLNSEYDVHMQNIQAINTEMAAFSAEDRQSEEWVSLNTRLQSLQQEAETLRQERDQTQEELAATQERIVEAEQKLETVTESAQETKLSLEGAADAVQAITQAREEAMGELRSAYRDFNGASDEAARAMGLDPDNSWIYRDEETGKFMVMNTDFTTNEGGSTTELEGRVPPEVLERLERADTRIADTWDTVSFHGESITYLENFVTDQQTELQNLKIEADKLREQITADQARSEELQGQLNTLDTRISEIETQMAEVQLQLDYNKFLGNEDVQRLVNKVANPYLSQDARKQAAEEVYNMAPANVQSYLQEKFPKLYGDKGAPATTQQAAATADPAAAPVTATATTGEAAKTESALEQGMATLSQDTQPAMVAATATVSARTVTSAANADGQGIGQPLGTSLSANFSTAAEGPQPAAEEPAAPAIDPARIVPPAQKFAAAAP